MSKQKLSWPKAVEFKGLMEKCGEKLSNGALESMVLLAVKDAAYVSEHIPEYWAISLDIASLHYEVSRAKTQLQVYHLDCASRRFMTTLKETYTEGEIDAAQVLQLAFRTKPFS